MPTTTSPAVFDEIAEIVARVTGMEPASLGPDTALDAELGIDSLGLVELVLAAEDRFGVSIPPEMTQVRTVGEAADYISERLPAAA